MHAPVGVRPTNLRVDAHAQGYGATLPAGGGASMTMMKKVLPTFSDGGVAVTENANCPGGKGLAANERAILPLSLIEIIIGTGKRGHYERGLFAGEISRISKISKFSRILLCFPQSGGSLDSLESLNSLESLENGLF